MLQRICGAPRNSGYKPRPQSLAGRRPGYSKGEKASDRAEAGLLRHGGTSSSVDSRYEGARRPVGTLAEEKAGRVSATLFGHFRAALE
jgi:hypothetical protein